MEEKILLLIRAKDYDSSTEMNALYQPQPTSLRFIKEIPDLSLFHICDYMDLCR